MKRIPMGIALLIVLSMFAIMAGCSSDSPTGGNPGEIGDLLTRSEFVDFNDPYGGFNMMDTPPAFGDPTIAEEYVEDATFDDPILNDAGVRDLTMTDTRPLFLLITWGNLHRDSTIMHGTDWSGSLSIDPGVLILKRTIRFEDRDHILPRDQRDLIEWVSYTQPRFDGILVRIIATPPTVAITPDSTIDSSATVLTFTTAPFSVEIKLSDLPGLNRIVTLDDGNAVAFVAVEPPDDSCPNGFMRGVWRNHPERRGGVFFGKWETFDGSVQGYMKGHYGVNDHGEKVFFGKMIDTQGRFEGIMKGRWGNNRVNGGWYAGHWVDRNLNIGGVLKGEWRRSDRCHGGFFRGGWAMNCDR